jgi:hypothetical protein
MGRAALEMPSARSIGKGDCPKAAAEFVRYRCRTIRANAVRFSVTMQAANVSDHEEKPQPKRGLLLRLLYRVYTNYLGVTPPTPAQERVAAVVLIAGTVLGLIAIVALVLFLWQTMMRMGAR